MEFPPLPMDLADWSIEILDELVKHPEIEGEKFDFKERRMGNLKKHICAMANTLGGVIVLGIGQGENGGKTQFYKDGWTKGEEDHVNKSVSDYVYNVEPVPAVKTAPLYDRDDKFYMLLKIEPVIRDRPYVIKGEGICYFRVNNQSVPASREMILALCKQTINRVEEIETLHAVTKMLREQLIYVDSKGMEILRRNNTHFFIPRVDLDVFKQLTSKNLWFVLESDLLEGRLIAGPERRHGLYTAINHIQELDSAINTYNVNENTADRRNALFVSFYTNWKAEHYQWLIDFLDRVTIAADKFLNER